MVGGEWGKWGRFTGNWISNKIGYWVVGESPGLSTSTSSHSSIWMTIIGVEKVDAERFVSFFLAVCPACMSNGKCHKKRLSPITNDDELILNYLRTFLSFDGKTLWFDWRRVIFRPKRARYQERRRDCRNISALHGQWGLEEEEEERVEDKVFEFGASEVRLIGTVNAVGIRSGKTE